MDTVISNVSKEASQIQEIAVKVSPLAYDSESFVSISAQEQGLSLREWLAENLNAVENLLSKKGAILFRGFDMDTIEKFNGLATCFNADPIPYMFRSSPRYSLADNVYVSTTYPSARTINMHSESSYSYVWGKKIMFCCIIAPQEQGETPIADNRRVIKGLSAGLINKFRDKGVLYQRLLSPHIGMPWQEVFQTDDQQEVINVCRENNIKCIFRNGTDLLIQWKRPAICEHPSTGELIWFNHAYFFNKYSIYTEMNLSPEDDLPEDLMPSNTFYGDGSEITYEDYMEIKSVYEAERVYFPWQTGDVLLLDNMLTAHGRNAYKGERKIVVAIMEPSS